MMLFGSIWKVFGGDMIVEYNMRLLGEIGTSSRSGVCSTTISNLKNPTKELHANAYLPHLTV